jgi:hypothetical protein
VNVGVQVEQFADLQSVRRTKFEAGDEPLTTMKMDQKVTQDELPRIEPFSASAELAGRYSVKPMSSPTTPQ